MNKRIVITGVGVLASNGEGKDAYWQALKEGKVGYKPVTLFDASEFNTNIGGEISEFDAKVYMGPKGLRLLDRSTKLLVSSAKLAIDHAKLVITEENTDDAGVSVGTTLGSIKSIAEFDEVTLKEGPRAVNPGLFPNTVINSPASQVSIWHKIKGFNTTISTGFTASMDALEYAYNFLQWDRASVILAGGVEEMCYHTFFGFHEIGFMSGSKKGQDFINCPFDRRRNGMTFAEGACLLVMESLEHAKKRKAPILAEIVCFGYSFDPFRINKYNPRGTGLKIAVLDALENADMAPSDINYICANANSTIADKIESQIINEVFGEHAKKIPVSAIKSMIGETFSVSGAMAVAASVGSLLEGFIPSTVNCLDQDPDCKVNVVTGQALNADLKNVMIINFGPNGSNTIMILRKYEK